MCTKPTWIQFSLPFFGWNKYSAMNVSFLRFWFILHVLWFRPWQFGRISNLFDKRCKDLFYMLPEQWNFCCNGKLQNMTVTMFSSYLNINLTYKQPDQDQGTSVGNTWFTSAWVCNFLQVCLYLVLPNRTLKHCENRWNIVEAWRSQQRSSGPIKRVQSGKIMVFLCGHFSNFFPLFGKISSLEFWKPVCTTSFKLLHCSLIN